MASSCANRGEGRECCSSRRRPGARAAGSASLPGPTQKLVATNRRPRVPLAASGGVGGRARGRGRLADAAANWWADPESPRKRGRLSAVRQARLCGSGSPLLQRSPWQSRSVSAQPSRAPRAVNCSPRPPRLLPPSPRPRCPKLHKTSAAARPTAPGEYLPVVGAICATLDGAGPRAWRSAWLRRRRPVRGAGAWRARGEEPVAGSAERLCSVPAVSPMRAASPGPGRIPSPDDFPNYFFSLYFILWWGGGEVEAGGRA